MSLVEIKVSTAVGFVIAWASWVYFPIPQLFDIDSSPSQGLGITLYFTMLSIVRGYAARRYFNGLNNKETEQ